MSRQSEREASRSTHRPSGREIADSSPEREPPRLTHRRSGGDIFDSSPERESPHYVRPLFERQPRVSMPFASDQVSPGSKFRHPERESSGSLEERLLQVPTGDYASFAEFWSKNRQDINNSTIQNLFRKATELQRRGDRSAARRCLYHLLLVRECLVRSSTRDQSRYLKDLTSKVGSVTRAFAENLEELEKHVEEWVSEASLTEIRAQESHVRTERHPGPITQEQSGQHRRSKSPDTEIPSRRQSDRHGDIRGTKLPLRQAGQPQPQTGTSAFTSVFLPSEVFSYEVLKGFTAEFLGPSAAVSRATHPKTRKLGCVISGSTAITRDMIIVLIERSEARQRNEVHSREVAVKHRERASERHSRVYQLLEQFVVEKMQGLELSDKPRSLSGHGGVYLAVEITNPNNGKRIELDAFLDSGVTDENGTMDNLISRATFHKLSGGMDPVGRSVDLQNDLTEQTVHGTGPIPLRVKWSQGSKNLKFVVLDDLRYQQEMTLGVTVTMERHLLDLGRRRGASTRGGIRYGNIGVRETVSGKEVSAEQEHRQKPRPRSPESPASPSSPAPGPAPSPAPRTPPRPPPRPRKPPPKPRTPPPPPPPQPGASEPETP